MAMVFNDIIGIASLFLFFSDFPGNKFFFNIDLSLCLNTDLAGDSGELLSPFYGNWDDNILGYVVETHFLI